MQVKTIAFYHYTFPAGGAEVVTCNLGRFFAKHGFRVLLYTWKPNAELLTEELRKSSTSVRCPTPNGFREPEIPTFSANR